MGVREGFRGGHAQPPCPPTFSPAPPVCSRCRWRCCGVSRTGLTSSWWGSSQGQSVTVGKGLNSVPIWPGSSGAPHVPPWALLPQALKQRHRASRNRRKCPSPETVLRMYRGKQASGGQAPPQSACQGWVRGGWQPLWAGLGVLSMAPRLCSPGLYGTCSLSAVGRKWA